ALLFLMGASSISLGIATLPSSLRRGPSEAKRGGQGLSIPDLPDILFTDLIVLYVVAGGAACLLSGVIVVTRWLQLFATDYLIGFLLIAGLVVCLRRPWFQFAKEPLLRAVLAAIYVIVVPGFLVFSQFAHMTLSDGRWWRFPIIAAAGLPLFLAD